MQEEQKTLDVPYYVQPTPITCQSTCLKMYAKYLSERYLQQSNPAAHMGIPEIWREINEGEGRPVKGRNAYENMRWWLAKYFAPLRFEVTSTKSVDEAIDSIVACINHDFPVMVSTNHARTDGHIILVIGYSRFLKGRASCSPEFWRQMRFVCHDPYGKFDPQLLSADFGRRRYAGGTCLAGDRGETGPGKAIAYDLQGVRRNRSDRHSASTFFMIAGRSH